MTAALALRLAQLQQRDQEEVVNQLNQAGKKEHLGFPFVARLQAWVEESVCLI
ncbi:MAG: hypothetical protein ACRD3D_05480 [Terriglobia bacterium]